MAKVEMQLTNVGVRFMVVLVFAIILAAGFPLEAQIVENTEDLLGRFQTIRDNMPGSGSEGFLKPGNEDLQHWRALVTALIEGQFEKADSLGRANLPFYTLYRFTDTGLDNRVYYLLQENNPVSRGWGSVMVNPQFAREICIEIPHPIHDTNTHRQGADIFRRTGARFLIMAGTHRCANAESSPCDGTSNSCGDGRYHVSDMAHFAQAPFQTVHEVVVEKFPGTYTLSMHGNSRSECEDVFFSNGHATQTTQLLFDLKADLLTSGGISAAVTGDGSACSLVGSTNVQGRFSSSSPQPCTQAAASSAITAFFIHVEQRRRVRDDFAVYSKLIDALNKNISTVTSVAAGPRNLAAESSELPFSIAIFPNPFTASATISYALRESRAISLRIYDVRGRLVRVLARQVRKDKGAHEIAWDGSDARGRPLPSGTYFLEFTAGRVTNRTVISLVR